MAAIKQTLKRTATSEKKHSVRFDADPLEKRVPFTSVYVMRDAVPNIQDWTQVTVTVEGQ